MRREYFSLEVSNVDWVDSGSDPETPELAISVDRDPVDVRRRFRGPDGELFEGSAVDVTYRLQEPSGDGETGGVVAVTDRVTGDYIIEINVPQDELKPLINAARRYGERTGDDTLYRVVVDADGERVVSYEKRTLLVYGNDGELLRGRSLIPSGVEI